MSGRRSRDKGRRGERALVQYLLGRGFSAERVPLSGAAGGKFASDVSVAVLGADWRIECKTRRLASASCIDGLACIRPLARRNNELPYQADYAAVSPLQVVASELGIAIVVVHHVRKMESEDPLDMVSGTTGLTGAADNIMVLNRSSQGVTLTGRGRDVEDFEVAVEFETTTGRWSILGAAQVVRRSGERNKIITALETADGALSPGDIAAVTGMPNPNVRQLLHSMVLDGEARKTQRGRYMPITTITKSQTSYPLK